MSAAAGIAYREGGVDDLRATFAISAHAVHDTATRLGVLRGPPPSEAQIEAEWQGQRDVLEFLAQDVPGSYWICDDGRRPVGYARVARVGGVEQLTELMVLPSHHRRGIGRALLERCWERTPRPGELRLVLAAGAPADLTLYSRFGVMPASGHWHLRGPASAFRDRRRFSPPARVTVLAPERAVESWDSLEPAVVGHGRRALHDFLARTRECVALASADGEARALCWVGPGGDVGPAIAATPAELTSTVLGALDRVASAAPGRELALYCTTANRDLLGELRRGGLAVHWPGWVMSSAPLPQLDRYLPMRPPHLL